MRIGILSRKADLYSTRRLKEAAVARGHDARVIDYLRCYMDITSRRPRVKYVGEELHFDAVIPRIGASYTFYGAAVVRQFEMMGVFAANESQAIARARDKLRSLQLLARAGVELPVTGFAHSTKDIDGLIEVVGKPPVVIKLLEGTQGKGVVLAETRKAADSVISAFRQLDANILVQRFVESGGTDLRAFVIGKRVVAAMERRAAAGEFRANLHRGATAHAVKLTPTERAMALKASRVLGLNVAGVDMLRGADGPAVIEVNSSPGLEGIESASGKDVAAAIVEFLERRAASGSTRDRVRG
jgi:ribosomal protein S6--L-glutamate ligase